MLANERVGAVSSGARRGSGRITAASAGSGLDSFNFFVANSQTGFGRFIAVYLTTQGWTQTQIGLALSVGTRSAMASQVPAGAFFFQAEDGIRVPLVTGVQTCALPILFGRS